jgi:molybdopterin synthase sulfur carrier subunit
LKILFHGRLAETVGPEMEVDAPHGCSVAELRERLITEHPETEQTLRSNRTRACVGDRLVLESHVLSASDILEFLPPVSGG